MLSRFPRRTDALLFVGVAVVAAVLTITALVSSLGQIGRVFPGFVVWDNLVVVALDRPHWTGTRAGVPFRTHVVRVDGEPVQRRADVVAILARSPVRTPHVYELAGADGIEQRTVASMTFTVGDWLATLGIYGFNGLAFLIAGLAVFYLKPDSRQSRALLAFGSIWGLMLTLCLDLFTAGRLDAVYFIAEALCPAAVLHFALTFPEPRPPVKRSGRILWIPYAIGLLVGCALVWLYHRDHAALLELDNGVWLAIIATGLLAMATTSLSAIQSTHPLARRRARVVLSGGVFAFALPMLALLALVILAQPVSASLLVVTGFLFPASIAYAIVRHDLFEADRFVKLSLVWATLTAIVSFTYAGTALATSRLAAEVIDPRGPLFSIGFVLVALATIVPLRERVQRAVDRLFFRTRVDYKSTVARIVEQMTTLLDRSAIVEHVVTTLRDVLFIPQATVWERRDDVLVRHGGPEDTTIPHELSTTDDAVGVVLRQGDVLSRDAVEESPALRRHRDPLRALFAALDAQLLVPFVRQGETVGFLAVGDKASGGPLSADDVDVLRTLGHETALSLANAATVEELQETRFRLDRAEHLAAIGELAAAVAHGIRNPLAGIRLAAQLGLEGDATADDLHENFEDVLSEVDKLESQVRGILDFARPFEPRLEPVAIRALVEPMVDTLAGRCAGAGIAIDVRIPDGLPPLRADRAHLTQVLHELTANAIDVMPHGGRLAIVVQPGGSGRVRIGVADTGPGVPAEMRERIFQLFTTTKSRGTGVGLAVARKIVERHGGTIAVEQAVPSGAIFVLELPAWTGAMR